MKTIIFDLDGTILDTLKDLTVAVNFGLRSRNLPEKDTEFVRLAIGNGTKVLIKRCTPCDISEEERQIAFDNFRSYYLQHFNDFTKPYPCVIEMLQRLKKNPDIRLIVVSNKDDDLTNKLIAKEFGNIFDVVQGSYLDKPRKPDPYLIEKVLKENGIKKEDCLYIGDTNIDRESATNAGLKYVLVNYGYRTKEELIKMCPGDTSISTVEELYDYINKWVNL